MTISAVGHLDQPGLWTLIPERGKRKDHMLIPTQRISRPVVFFFLLQDWSDERLIWLMRNFGDNAPRARKQTNKQNCKLAPCPLSVQSYTYKTRKEDTLLLLKECVLSGNCMHDCLLEIFKHQFVFNIYLLGRNSPSVVFYGAILEIRKPL